ncbi:unnamed protein product, partial [Iphiclides podalirius]
MMILIYRGTSSDATAIVQQWNLLRRPNAVTYYDIDKFPLGCSHPSEQLKDTAAGERSVAPLTGTLHRRPVSVLPIKKTNFVTKQTTETRGADINFGGKHRPLSYVEGCLLKGKPAEDFQPPSVYTFRHSENFNCPSRVVLGSCCKHLP